MGSIRTPQSNPAPANLAGSLLLAHPVLRDPNFRRTAVMMSVHSDQGAMGVVLNRPMGKTLGTLNGSFAYGPLSSVSVYAGGPVQLDQLILIGWQRRDDGFRLHFGIEPDQAAELVAREDVVIRAFVGFSGWSAGQLENEMSQNTWVAVPMAPDLISIEPGPSLWKNLLGRLGPEWRLLADEPDDLANN